MITYDIHPEHTRPIDMMHQFSMSHEWFETWHGILNDTTNTLSDQARNRLQQGMLLYVDRLTSCIEKP